jgi:hypothetical protein
MTLTFGFFQAARADVTYYYTGNPLDVNGNLPSITAAFTFDNTVNPGFSGVVYGPDVVSETASGAGLTYTTPYAGCCSFTFNDGSIVQWSWSLGAPGAAAGEYITSINSPPQVVDGVCPVIFCTGLLNFNNPGTWSTTPPAVQFSVTPSIVNGVTMQATATPLVDGTPISLQEAESLTNFTGFNFYQQVIGRQDPTPVYPRLRRAGLPIEYTIYRPAAKRLSWGAGGS